MVIPGCSWSRNHQIMMGTYMSAKTVDILQTRSILSDQDYYELNPILKDLSPDQATGMMLISALGVWMIANEFPEYRTWIIGIPMMISLGLVFHNMKIGVEF